MFISYLCMYFYLIKLVTFVFPLFPSFCCYRFSWRIKIFNVVAHHKYYLRTKPTPFPQIDIIGDVVIVWRVRGKTIRSVLCNIVCNNCALCDAHTYEQTNSSLDWVLFHWAHFTVLDSFLYCVLLCAVLHDCLGL